MQILGWTLTRTAPPRENARQRATQEAVGASGGLDRLNQLETRVERLELDHADRQLRVLTAVEKVMHQLRARERKRERMADAETETELPVDRGPESGRVGAVHPGNGGSAHLAARFRRF